MINEHYSIMASVVVLEKEVYSLKDVTYSIARIARESTPPSFVDTIRAQTKGEAEQTILTQKPFALLLDTSVADCQDLYLSIDSNRELLEEGISVFYFAGRVNQQSRVGDYCFKSYYLKNYDPEEAAKEILRKLR